MASAPSKPIEAKLQPPQANRTETNEQTTKRLKPNPTTDPADDDDMQESTQPPIKQRSDKKQSSRRPTYKALEDVCELFI
jgi:hypothetical protein